jgi:hypothetical protein
MMRTPALRFLADESCDRLVILALAHGEASRDRRVRTALGHDEG